CLSGLASVFAKFASCKRVDCLVKILGDKSLDHQISASHKLFCPQVYFWQQLFIGPAKGLSLQDDLQVPGDVSDKIGAEDCRAVCNIDYLCVLVNKVLAQRRLDLFRSIWLG